MRNSKWKSCRKRSNSQHEVVCDCCGERPLISHSDYQGLQKEFPFYCSKACVKSAILEGIEAEPATLLVCPPKVSKTELTCWSEKVQKAFRSLFEVHVAEWLTEEGFQFDYELFGVVIGDREVWTVDFFVERKVLLEVKGRWSAGGIAKAHRFRKQYPDQPLVFIPWAIHGEFYTLSS